jgi:prophage regulatory protein
MARTIIRFPLVEARTGLKRSSIYAGVAEGTFPAQIPLGGRAVGWDEDEVNAWIEQRAAEAQAHASMHVNKAAEEIGVPLEELQPFIDSGELPTYRLGRHQLVKKTVLSAFQKKHAVLVQGQVV